MLLLHNIFVIYDLILSTKHFQYAAVPCA